MPKKFGPRFRRFLQAWEVQKKELTVVIARRAENHFKDGFRFGGLVDYNVLEWAPRKKADPGRALLVKSGRLKRGIRAVPTTNAMEIKIANDVPYAKYHNEGIPGRLPQRKFMGLSTMLVDRIRRDIVLRVQRAFN